MVNGARQICLEVEVLIFLGASATPLPMQTFNDTSSLLNFLRTRKSGSAKTMGEPGPSADQIRQMLELAVRVPDHGKLTPWRFILFEGASRTAIGKHFAARWRELNPAHGAETLVFQETLFTRAPTVMVVVSTAAQHPKIPVWEQQMSAAAVCFNLELAAAALGFHPQWQTDWVAYDAAAKAAMGVKENENVAGIIYIGTSTVPLEDRPRPDPTSLLTIWNG
jgi:nitroreductase